MKAPKIGALNTSFSDPFTFSVSSSAASTWISLLLSYLCVHLLAVSTLFNGREKQLISVGLILQEFYFTPFQRNLLCRILESYCICEKGKLDFTNDSTWMAVSVGNQEKYQCKDSVCDVCIYLSRLCTCNWRADVAFSKRKDSGSLYSM